MTKFGNPEAWGVERVAVLVGDEGLPDVGDGVDAVLPPDDDDVFFDVDDVAFLEALSNDDLALLADDDVADLALLTVAAAFLAALLAILIAPSINISATPIIISHFSPNLLEKLPGRCVLYQAAGSLNEQGSQSLLRSNTNEGGDA